MSRPDPTLFSLYRRSLRLYPSRLRLLYQDQMLQTVRDADAERTRGALSFWLSLFSDLLKSSIKEHLLVVRKQVLARPALFYTLTLAILFTVWGFAAAITMQQLLRRGADQPQIQTAQNYTSALTPMPPLAGGPSSHPLSGHVDPSISLEPFVILYDSRGNPLRSNGYLDGAVPVPPAGVFAYLRTHPTDKFTWQPRPGLRIAAVAQRIDGPQAGFILVGRSLALVQQQEDLLRHGAFITWFCLMAILIAGGVFLNRAQTRRAT